MDENLAVGAPLERNVRHCWPTPWLEAAMRAGFAYPKGNGEWVFINDKLRDMLADFAHDLQKVQREHLAELMERQPTFIASVAAANLIRKASQPISPIN